MDDDSKEVDAHYAEELMMKPLATSKSRIKINPYMEADIIPRHPASILFCGKSGSGKTMTLVNMLKDRNMYGGYFDIIFLFSETASFGGDDIYKKHLGRELPSKRMFQPDKEGLKKINKIVELQKDIIEKQGIEKSPKILIIFDDVAHAKELLKSQEYLLLHIANRHLNISTFSLVQSYTKMPRACRCQVSAIMFFHGCTGTEKERLSEEHTPAGFNHKRFLPIIDHAIADKYSFLFINKFAPNKIRHRKGLHEILELRD